MNIEYSKFEKRGIMARILVIDDTKNIRKMVELTLKSAGHETETADDGEEGLTKFGDGTTWDLTIVDQQMPRLEGREFVKAARQRDSSTRIIMMTAFATIELASEIMQMGAVDFLRKPFSTETLRGAVESALSHPKAIVLPSSTETASTSEAAKPEAAGFVVPRISYRLNGFSFWPLPASSTRSSAPNMEIGTTFQVREPSGRLSECFVGITEHIRQQAQHDFGGQINDNDHFWEALCGEALSEFFWKQSQTPPAILPVFEIPKKLLEARRSPVSWGFYTKGQ